MKKPVLYPILEVFCDACGKQITSDYYIRENGRDYCNDYCKSNSKATTALNQ